MLPAGRRSQLLSSHPDPAQGSISVGYVLSASLSIISKSPPSSTEGRILRQRHVTAAFQTPLESAPLRSTTAVWSHGDSGVSCCHVLAFGRQAHRGTLGFLTWFGCANAVDNDGHSVSKCSGALGGGRERNTECTCAEPLWPQEGDLCLLFPVLYSELWKLESCDNAFFTFPHIHKDTAW